MEQYIKKELWIEQDGMFVQKTNEVESAFGEDKAERLYMTEDNSWWFQYRASVIIHFLNCFFEKGKNLLDLGGGNGYTTSVAMKQGYHVALMEPSYPECLNARKRKIPNIYCGTFDEGSINNESVEQIMLLDVLEHIEDDRKFLKLIYKKLKIEGVCMVTVPALMSLWSSNDVTAGHFRRYTLDELKSRAEAEGFKVMEINYFMKFLYLPIWIVRVLFERIGIIKKSTARTKEEEDEITEKLHRKNKGIVDIILGWCQKLEIKRLFEGKKVRFGSSIICVMQKI